VNNPSLYRRAIFQEEAVRLHLISLGCARNLVDSEVMLGRLKDSGWTVVREPETADTIIVNTCSFIESAADESIDTILEVAKLKKKGPLKRLIVAGCLPERYREEIQDVLPEVDCFLGTGAFNEIVTAVQNDPAMSRCHLPDPDRQPVQGTDVPRVREIPFAAYLKIAEGCSRNCTYCIIPRLRGRQKSRRMEDIVAEAESLICRGVREVTMVAQDTTFYGRDLSPAVGLDRLLQSLSNLSDKVWFRVLYGHPESLDGKVLQTIDSRSNICSYFDIPIQHASSGVLKRMGRNYTEEDLYRLFDQIRTGVPGAALRTTVIVGFPGETDEDFNRLLELMEKIRFDHLGAFIYSDSRDLPSHRLSGHVPKSVAEHRRDEVMIRQQGISLNINQQRIGQTFTVLLEEEAEPGLFIGRTTFQAPEVDGVTYVRPGNRDEGMKAGVFADVKMTDAMEYDLVGESV